MMQLAGGDSTSRAAFTATSDSLGHFSFDSVPDGRFRLGFYHPIIDSLGIDPPLREVRVESHRPVRVDVAIPGAERVRAAVCGPRFTADSAGVVIGVVRNTHDREPVAGAAARGEWLELSIRRGGYDQAAKHLDAKTGENGWFALCNVPRGGTVVLSATHGADSTDHIEVQVPPDGFLRRDLYVGSSRATTIGTATNPADSGASAPRRIRIGDVHLTGKITAKTSGRALPGALVSILNGPQTRANDSGDWSVPNAPPGSRMLWVRAIGYYPQLRAIDIVDNASSVRVSMETMQSVLDTVRVVATRLDRYRKEFEERQRSGAGRYLDSTYIAHHAAVFLSEAFRMVSGLHVSRSMTEGKTLTMRGVFEDQCSPTIYMNGLRGFDMNDVDTVPIEHVVGIEIYNEANVPPQYRDFINPCGSVLIWTK